MDHYNLSMIVAASDNGVIGRNGGIPWVQRDDMKRFVRLTTGKPIVMGSQTFQSIGKVLPGRKNIVLSRRAGPGKNGATVVSSPEQALKATNPDQETVIIGGEQVYRLFLPWVSKIYMTRVHACVNGDAFFPALDEGEWEVSSEESFGSDARNYYPMTFRTLNRTWYSWDC